MSDYQLQFKLRRLNCLIGIFLFVGLFITGCNSGKKKLNPALEKETTGAKRFSLKKKEDFTELKIINPWQGAHNVTQIYHLVKRGALLPAGTDSSSVIFVPLKSIICMSTTHVAMISALGEEKTITGFSGTGFIFSEKLVKYIKNGSIADVGYEANLNKELILKIEPDLIMMYGIGSESAGYVGKLKELGIKVVFNADYLETDPLSKAEWIKLFGALYCKENLADSIYKTEADNYNKLKNFISQNISVKPSVLLGLPYKETWYVSPGNSFICKLISDAGGNYIWKDTESSVSMPYGIESVYIKAMNAEYWLNIGSAKSKAEISSVDQRLADLPCFKSGKLFNNNNRITINEGNDFWESGTIYPHLILKDIAMILHPELFQGDELYYYKKIN